MMYDFPRVVEDVRELSGRITDDGFLPDVIVAVARGGWIPARILSNFLAVRTLVSVGTEYHDTGRKELRPYQLPYPELRDRRVIVVDDCLESGRSLHYVGELLQSSNEVRTAALYITKSTVFMPNFFVRDLSEVPRFPWEV